jgi:hypothetical protein
MFWEVDQKSNRFISSCIFLKLKNELYSMQWMYSDFFLQGDSKKCEKIMIQSAEILLKRYYIKMT